MFRWISKRLSRLLIAVLSAILFSWSANTSAAAPLPQSPQYQTAASILALPADQIQRGAAVRLRGVVTLPGGTALIVQDATAGIWIYLDHPQKFAQGDEVEIEGHVHQGLFSPVVNGKVLRLLGRAPLPKPRVATFREISTGELDSQYVSITGVVLSTGLSYHGSKHHLLSLRIEMAGGVVAASFPETNTSKANGLIGALIRITAPVECIKNQNRQIIAPILSGNSIDRDILILKPAPQDLFAGPLMNLNRVMQYRSGTDYWHRVHVAGVVTYYNPGEGLYLEDGSQGLLIETDQIDTIRPGDWVEAVGFPAPRGFGPVLQYAMIRNMGRQVPCRPILATIRDLSSGELNNVLVRIEGKLVRHVREPFGYVLLIQDSSNLVLAELDHDEPSLVLQQLQDGSRVAVTGISFLSVEGTWNYGVESAYAIRPKILLRSSSDVQTLGPPTWWTIRHMVYISMGLTLLAIVFLVQLIRARLHQWRIEAMHIEKERLSNEIHDTLAQSFAGIGFQLQAIRKAAPEEFSDLRQQVDHARDLVRYSHKEALRSITQLESNVFMTADPIQTLRDVATKLVTGGTVKISTTETGKPVPLPPRVSDALIRIGQEAIANAVRHADPQNLRITLEYRLRSVRLVVQDDGMGFVYNGELLGFGLRSMRNRAAAISASIEFKSQPDCGTSVIVIAPLPRNAIMQVLFPQWLH